MGCRQGFTLVFAVLLCAALPVCADVPPNRRGEVAHLLDYVATSGCLFERNGEWYSPAEAREHIRKKYDHFREQISTTEEFVRRSATKSLPSGRRYMVKCGGGDPLPVGDWLLRELEAYRAGE